MLSISVTKQKPHPFSKSPKFRHNRLNSKSPKKKKKKRKKKKKSKINAVQAVTVAAYCVT